MRLLQVSHSGAEGIPFLDHAGEGLHALHLDRYFLSAAFLPTLDLRVMLTGSFFHVMNKMVSFLFELSNMLFQVVNLRFTLPFDHCYELIFLNQLLLGRFFQWLILLHCYKSS